MVQNHSLAARLRWAVEASGKTQGELAAAVGATQSAVSQWLAGKKEPRRDAVEKIAQHLGVDGAWLLTGKGPEPDITAVLERERAEYQAESDWNFRPQPADGGRDYGNANIWTFKPDIDTFVRETVQNLVDAGREPIVRATFRVIRLKGAEMAKFFKALKWDQLQPHIAESSTNKQQLGQALQDGLHQVVDRHELLLLRVSDSGTTGLTGDETGSGSKFAALCRNNLDSEKEQATAGGSFGLGRAVLWRMSQLSTVVFCSNPVPPEDGEVGGWRIIGRSDLAWHQQAGKAFAGPGWFGRRNDAGEPPVTSYWGNRVLARDLLIDRAPDDLGTSILVVGFHDPSSEEALSPAEIAQRIAQAAATHFWPVLAMNKLVVTVEVAEGDAVESTTRVDVAQLEPAFTDAMTKSDNGEVVARLREPGDVVRVSLDLEVPACVAEGLEHPAMTHKPVLLVRLAAEGDKSANLRHAALFRGTGMVVEYLDLERVALGARPFHAAVLCGKAAAVDKPAVNAEIFLRTAEPPAHNRWEYTPALKRNYARGSWKALRDFREQIKREVRDLVGPPASDLSDGPQALKELLRLTTPIPVEKVPRVTRASGEPDASGRWEVEATLRVPVVDSAWRGQPVLLFGSESHGGRAVEWDRLEALSNCKVEDGHLVIPAGRTTAKFRGWARRESQPVPAAYATVTVDFRKPEKVEEAAG